MKRKYLIIIITLLLMLPFYKLYAQNDSIRDNSYYFDDGGISNAKNVIKLNVASIIKGDLPFYYERVICKAFSIEIGVGVLLPYYTPGITDFINDEEIITDPDFGYSLWVFPKYYPQRKAPELYYIGIQYRRRNYNQMEQTIVRTDVCITQGLQYIFGKRFALDFDIGIGFLFTKEKASITNIEPYSEISGLAIPIGIKLGIIL